MGHTLYKGGQFVGSLFSGDLQKASNASQAFLGTFVDLGFDAGATLVPFVPAGLTHADDAGRWANKLNPDFRPGRVTKGVRDLDISNRAIKSAKGIAGFTKEGMNQIVTRGLSPGIIQDTLKNTVKYTQRIDSLGRTSFRYVGEKATLNFNKAGEFVTGWLKDSNKLLNK